MFTKFDLRNGDVVKKRNGNVEIVILDTNTLVVNRKGCCNILLDINDDLTSRIGRNFDIMEVRRPYRPGDSRFDAFDNDKGEVVFQR